MPVIAIYGRSGTVFGVNRFDCGGGYMDLPGTAYLYTLAALSVTFVGFSALVVVLRQSFGGEMSRLDILITRIFIQLGFIVVAGAMLPPLLFLFQWPESTIWRAASLVPALPSFLFAVTYPSRRFAATGMVTPFIVWIDILILLIASAVLFCNALGLGFHPAPGPFAAGLTIILFLAGFAFLQAMNTILPQHLKRKGRHPAEGRHG
jgi:hypothetical protein